MEEAALASLIWLFAAFRLVSLEHRAMGDREDTVLWEMSSFTRLGSPPSTVRSVTALWARMTS